MTEQELEDKIQEENARIQMTRLDNGAWVITRTDPSLPNIQCACLMKAGSYDEVVSSSPRGTAHFLEHVMWHNKKVNGKLIALDFFPSDFIAYTTRKSTVFFGCLKKAEGFSPVTKVLDTLCNPRFDRQTVENERRRIILERGIKAEGHYLFDFREALHSPYEMPIVGDRPQTLERIEAKTLYAFHQAHYFANRTIVVVQGDVEHNSVVDVVEKGLTLPRGPNPYKFEKAVYVGDDRRHHHDFFLPGQTLCSLTIPLQHEDQSKVLALAQLFALCENPGRIHSHVRECCYFEEGYVFDYGVSHFGYGLKNNETLFSWGFRTLPSCVAGITAAIHKEVANFVSVTEDAANEFVPSMQSLWKNNDFIPSLSQPVDVVAFARRAGREIFGGEKGALSCDQDYRAIMSLTPDDFRQTLGKALASKPTFRALGALRGLPSPRKLQEIFAKG